MDRVLNPSVGDVVDARVGRPAAIWLGLASFFLGSILFGVALASTGPTAPAGPLLMLLGVALVGGGFTMEPSGFEYDAELEFSGFERYAIVGVSGVFVLLAALLLVLVFL